MLNFGLLIKFGKVMAHCTRLLPSIRPTMPFLDLRFSQGYSGSGFGELSQKRRSLSSEACRRELPMRWDAEINSA